MKECVIMSVLLLLSTLTYGQTYSKDLEKQAKKGNVTTQYKIGLCYLNANGITADKKKAKKWLQRAADQGHADAMYQLALIGKSENSNDWVSLLEKSANSGSSNAQYELYKTTGDSQWLKKAADSGNANAIYDLAKITDDRQEKLALLERAAEQGHSTAKSEAVNLKRQIEEEARLLAEQIKAVKEGRLLPSLSLLYSLDSPFRSLYDEKNQTKFYELCDADFNKMMGIDKMDKLDLLRYKKSEKYEQDQVRFEDDLNQIFYYTIDLNKEEYPRIKTEFSTNGFTVNIEHQGRALKRVDNNHLTLWWYSGVYFPLLPNVVSDNGGSRKLFFPCNDLDLLYKIKDDIYAMTLVLLCKPGFNYKDTYFAKPVAMYIAGRGKVVMDLSKYIRNIDSDSEVKREKDFLDADMKENEAAERKREKEYRNKPKQARRTICGNCHGKGYVASGRAYEYSKCPICFGDGYMIVTW